MENLCISLPSGDMSLNIYNSDYPINDLFGFACRQNPKRGFLFVSKVLGKHYPVKPKDIFNTYENLSNKLELLLDNNDKPLFIGFAETATGLGLGIYDNWKQSNLNVNSLFIHTTRYNFNKKTFINFEEEHSHSTGHIVFEPEAGSEYLYSMNTLILIDDEITTGNTLKNFIDAFINKHNNIKKVVIISLKNWMSNKNIELFKSNFLELDIHFTSILTGEYQFTQNKNYICEKMPNVDSNKDFKDDLILNNHGRFGLVNVPEYNLDLYLKNIDITKKTLVIGTGEFHYPPLLLAAKLEKLGTTVYYQSTTRSPISLGHDIKNKISFLDNYNDKINNFIYNVDKYEYEQIIICYETNSKNDLELDIILDAQNIFF